MCVQDEAGPVADSIALLANRLVSFLLGCIFLRSAERRFKHLVRSRSAVILEQVELLLGNVASFRPCRRGEWVLTTPSTSIALMVSVSRTCKAEIRSDFLPGLPPLLRVAVWPITRWNCT